MMDSQQIIETIRDLAADPLGVVMTQEFQTKQGVIRWHGGFVQVRRNGDENFSLGMTPDDFFQVVDVVPIDAKTPA